MDNEVKWYVFRVVHGTEESVVGVVNDAWFPKRVYSDGGKAVTVPLVHGIFFYPCKGDAPHWHYRHKQNIFSLMVNPDKTPITIADADMTVFRLACNAHLNRARAILDRGETLSNGWVAASTETISKALKTLLGPAGFEFEVKS